MKGESGLFRIFVILFVGLVVITGVVYFSLLIFDAEPTRYRRVLYSFMPNFRAVEFVATLIPNPKIIDGYFLNDIVKNSSHRVSSKWSNAGIDIRPSYHKDLVHFVGTVVQVNSKKNTVDIKVQDNRYTLNLRPYTYYYKPGPHPEISKSGDINLKPVSRLMDVKLLEIGKIAYFLVYDGGEFLTVINVEL